MNENAQIERRPGLTVLLVAVAILAPLLAYAGINVILPVSTHHVETGGTPPVTFAMGADYHAAAAQGLLLDFARRDDGASFSVIVRLGAGQTLTIDRYAEAHRGPATTSYRLELSQVLAGSLQPEEFAYFKLRLWSGGTPPTSDTSGNVCGVLDLASRSPLVSTGGPCAADVVHFQLLVKLAHNAYGASIVGVRPTNVHLA
jgi:hypothetical protein